MVKIAPSIFAADFAALERDLRKTDTADSIHIDVMDGKFVPNFSIGMPVIRAIRRSTKVPLDVHLMIDRPIRYVEEIAACGADLISIHYEADTKETTLSAIRKIHSCGKKAGLVIKPATQADVIVPFLPYTDLILVMTIEPGIDGQAFMDSQLPVIRRVRDLIRQYHPSCDLEVDGGINLATAPSAVAAGATMLVAGTAVFSAQDIPAMIRRLRNA